MTKAVLLISCLMMCFPWVNTSESVAVQVLQVNENEKDTMKKIRVEIWSDVVCPFCYIGKRKFEEALKKYDHSDQVEVIWKSFQLSPESTTEPGKSMNAYLAEMKGISEAEAGRMHEYVTKMAKEVGLVYDFSRAVVANSFNAHRLIQLSKAYNRQDAIEEALFKAYFTEGKNIDDRATLLEIAAEAGLDSTTVSEMLQGDTYGDAVRSDIREAQAIGVTGVPFFVFNREFAISGAQDEKVFLKALRKAGGEE